MFSLDRDVSDPTERKCGSLVNDKNKIKDKFRKQTS